MADRAERGLGIGRLPLHFYIENVGALVVDLGFEAEAKVDKVT